MGKVGLETEAQRGKGVKIPAVEEELIWALLKQLMMDLKLMEFLDSIGDIKFWGNSLFLSQYLLQKLHFCCNFFRPPDYIPGWSQAGDIPLPQRSKGHSSDQFAYVFIHRGPERP